MYNVRVEALVYYFNTNGFAVNRYFIIHSYDNRYYYNDHRGKILKNQLFLLLRGENNKFVSNEYRKFFEKSKKKIILFVKNNLFV